MTTLQSELNRYAPGITLDRIVGRKVRRGILRVLTFLIVLLSFMLIGEYVFRMVTGHTLTVTVVPYESTVVLGLLLTLLGPTMILFGFSFFYNTLYYRGLVVKNGEDLADGEGITSEVASICLTGGNDLMATFFTHGYGREIIGRLGLTETDIDEFLRGNRARILPDSIPLRERTFVTLFDVSTYLYESDPTLGEFLLSKGITRSVYEGAAEWVYRVRAVHKYRSRWWSRDNLAHIQGIGRDLSYGVAKELGRFAKPLGNTAVNALSFTDNAYANERIHEIETILTKSKAANVLLVGEPGVGKMDLLIELGRRMREGNSAASLTGKRLTVLDYAAFSATYPEKESFELAFLKLMSEAERAGNIIIVIEHFDALVTDLMTREVNVGELLGRFLASAHIQIVGTADPGGFHTTLETNTTLLQHFALVKIETPNQDASIRVLEDATRPLELRHHIFFTYAAVARIAEHADQYIVDGVMPEKALSLLSEVAAHGVTGGVRTITPEYVDTMVSEKVGIPIGPIQESERDTLLNLEAVLHERVVGQDAAVDAVARTMRRARAGIQSKERPIGSFLFLGSTGVGKTETAKALAHVFFGSESSMVRFDMSEYSDTDALARLIGTPTRAGTLASALREHPYCVLLLDEFEKAVRDVHDLFLQVLDEGVFTDARGMKVNARNTIVIATSNAGSALIFEMMQEGKNPEEGKDAIIDNIIKERIFRPELVNRFDATIIFEALGEGAQKEIAKHMLTELEERIKQKGFTLVIDDTLLEVLMEHGYDPEFGARPMRRAIQDLIEERIATKIIKENLKPGSVIHFTPGDFLS